MKRRNVLILTSLSLFFLFSCSPKVVQIGKLNMLSTRNVESQANYVLLKSYMGASKKELKKSTAQTIEDAVDATVRNTAGGEFLKNVKLYSVQNGSKMSFAVEGDIWGIAGVENFRGFKVGDMVQWKDITGVHKGKITGLKDASECMIKEDGQDASKTISYDKLSKINE